MRMARGAALCVLILSIPNIIAAQQQSTTIDIQGVSLTTTSMSLIGLLTILSLAPAILMMVTCFPFMVTVLAIVRQAIGLQQSPPNMLMVGLALFLTWFVMEPVFMQSWQQGLQPFSEEEIEFDEAFDKTTTPFYNFMLARVDPDVLNTIQTSVPNQSAASLDPQRPKLSHLMVSFLISELTRAFKIGFLIFLPFLIIDMVVSAVLMSMGMMMVPPSMVALPFKLGFFAMADGWTMIAIGLTQGYSP